LYCCTRGSIVLNYSDNWSYLFTDSHNVLRDISYIEENILHAVGHNGTFCSSNNNGVNWVFHNTGIEDDILSVFFMNSQNGWITTNTGKVLYTLDGGQNWIISNINASFEIHDIFFIDEDNGWAAADSGKILKTIDGGINWEIIQIDFNLPLFAVYFPSYLKGYTVTQQGRIYHSIDGGESWELQHNTIDWIYDVFFIDDQIGWACGGAQTLHRTTNGGETWVSTQGPFVPPEGSMYNLYSESRFPHHLQNEIFRDY